MSSCQLKKFHGLITAISAMKCVFTLSCSGLSLILIYSLKIDSHISAMIILFLFYLNKVCTTVMGITINYSQKSITYLLHECRILVSSLCKYGSQVE